MAERGAPLGNTNAKKSLQWRENLDRAIKQDDGKRLRQSAEMLLDLAAAGESWAVQMLADRLDGKVPQAITGADGGALQVNIIAAPHDEKI